MLDSLPPALGLTEKVELEAGLGEKELVWWTEKMSTCVDPCVCEGVEAGLPTLSRFRGSRPWRMELGKRSPRVPAGLKQPSPFPPALPSSSCTPC